MVGAAGIVKGLALTLLIQLILVSLFFFVTYEVVSIFTPRPFAQDVTMPEMAILAAAAVLSVIGTATLSATDGQPECSSAEELVKTMAVDDDDDHEADLVMSNQAVTLDNFFAGRHSRFPTIWRRPSRAKARA